MSTIRIVSNKKGVNDKKNDFTVEQFENQWGLARTTYTIFRVFFVLHTRLRGIGFGEYVGLNYTLIFMFLALRFFSSGRVQLFLHRLSEFLCFFLNHFETTKYNKECKGQQTVRMFIGHR